MASDAAGLLAPITRERIRVLAPTLLAVVLVYLAISGWMGIVHPWPALVFDGVVIAVLAVLTVLVRQRRIPERWIQFASVGVWWCPISITLMTQYATHDIALAYMVVAQIATVGVLLHTGLAVGSLLGATALAVPLAIRDGGASARVFVVTIIFSDLFALLIHVLVRKAMLRAERHRLAEAETARRLALQVTDLERAHAERSLLQAQLLHSQRMDAVGALAAGVAHDMNNILASITSLSGLVLEDVDRDGAAYQRQRRADLEQVLAQSARGAALIQSLLAFSRRGQYRKQVVLVADVVRDVLPLLARTLPKSIEIQDRIAVGQARIDGDPVHLQQALVNLGLNAADAMHGTGTLVISATLDDLDGTEPGALGLAPGRYVRIGVTDTGTGVDAETRHRMFEPFFTTKPLGQGTGLGLSMVWGIAQAHGGGVDVISELGRGSTFALQLPITDELAAVVPARAGPVASRAPVARKGTVLVVDDEQAVRQGTTRLLERMGFDVVGAADGAEAVQVFGERAGSIALVILDMGMPVMGGRECFARLRDQSDVPILIATGYAVDAEMQALVAAGAGLLEKPYRLADLTREVTRMLEGGFANHDRDAPCAAAHGARPIAPS